MSPDVAFLIQRCASLRDALDNARLGLECANHRIEQLCAFIDAAGLEVPRHVYKREAA